MITHEKNSTPIQKLELYSCYSLIFRKKERKKYLFFSSAHMGEMFFPLFVRNTHNPALK